MVFLKNTKDNLPILLINKFKNSILFAILCLSWIVAFSQKKTLNNFSYQEMLDYITISYLMFNLLNFNNFHFENKIKDDNINNYVLNPKSIFLMRFRREAISNLASFFISIIEIALLYKILNINSIYLINRISHFNLISATSILLSLVLNYYLYLILSFLSLWNIETRSIKSIFQSVVFKFGGLFIPLSFASQSLFTIILASPLYYIYYFPVSTFFNLNTNLLPLSFSIVSFWILTSCLLAHLMWEKGLIYLNNKNH